MIRRRAPRDGALPWGAVLGNGAFVLLAIGISIASGYAIYESRTYLITVGLAALAGAAIAVVTAALGRGRATAALAGVVAYVALGLTVATSATASLTTRGLDLVRGPVFGWKDIVTLPLPLGSYGATLVPMLMLFLVSSLVATSFAIRAHARWALAPVVTGALLIVVIVVGPALRSDPVVIGPVGITVTRELLAGLALFLIMLAWFGWRAASERRRAIAHAHGTTGVRTVRAPRSHAAAGIIAVTLLLVVGTSVATVAAGPLEGTSPREVARSGVDPRLTISSTVTPLASFRDYFTTDAYEAVLFSVAVTEGAPDRARVATLSHFDGQGFTAAAGPDAPPTRFQRLPSRIAGPDDARPVSATVTVGLGGGIWVPIVGELGSVRFQGARQAQLVDGFYYLPDAAAGVMVAAGGLVPGDTFQVSGYVPETPRTLADLGSPSGVPTLDTSLIPESLSDWVARQEVSRDGAGLAELVDRLRVRGYLSHALDGEAQSSAWRADLPGYAFAASPAGHSYDRIDRMFLQLTEREAEVGNSTTASLVAAVGDDEQFAVATALIAAELGFPSRVVLGARLAETDERGWSAPPCEDGECRGRNMSAWTEVQDRDGSWVAVDVTPQHENPPAPDVTTQRDPEFVSALDPLRAEPIVPPSTQRGAATDDEAPEVIDDTRWPWLLPALRILGISLLVLLLVAGPVVAILAWKAARRRRRRHGEPTAAVHGGWDEYLDTAVESGLEPLPLLTRTEVAEAYGSQHGPVLAMTADRATFSGGPLSAAEAEEFWALVEADRDAWRRSRGWWARLRMSLSLRSLWRSVTESAPAAPEKPSNAPRWRSEHTAMTSRSRQGRRSTRSWSARRRETRRGRER